MATFLVLSITAVSSAQFEVFPLGISGGEASFENGILVLEVLEEVEGRDLNGDGDLADGVLHRVDAETRVVDNLGLAVWYWVREGRFLAAMVYEPSQGAGDLNGNGTVEDWVLFVVDLETATVLHPGLAATGLVVEDGYVAFGVPESQQAVDLNEDGDLGDRVLHSLETATGVVRNHHLAVDVGIPFRVRGGKLAAAVAEANEALIDRNGDGDVLDDVLCLIELPEGRAENLSHATEGFRFAGDRYLLYDVLEDRDGFVDLNADGDTTDSVVLVHDVLTGQSTSSGLASHLIAGGGADRVATAVYESGQGVDLNGDGDAFDNVLHVFDPTAGALVNLGVAALGRTQVEGDLVATNVYEGDQGQMDLNGDGDVRDSVLHLYDAASGELRNVGVDGGLFELGDQILMIPVEEAMQGMDLNGDGDRLDLVAEILDPAETKPRNLSLTTSYRLEVQGHLAAFVVREDEEGKDLNGDGDLEDGILHLYDAFRDTITNTGLETYSVAIDGYRVAAAVPETDTDWNGDGDTLDPIVHLVSYQPPAALRLAVNGQRPESHVVATPGAMRLALDVSRGGDDRLLDWYFGLVYDGVTYWIAPGGIAIAPRPLLTKTAAFDGNGIGLANLTLSPGQSAVFVLVLVEGSTIVDSDFVAAVGVSP